MSEKTNQNKPTQNEEGGSRSGSPFCYLPSRLTRIAGRLTGHLRGCPNCEPDGGGMVNRWLREMAADLRDAADTIEQYAAPERDLMKERKDAEDKIKVAEKQAKDEAARRRKSEKKNKDLRERIKSLEASVQALGEANLSRPPIEELVQALLLVMTVNATIPLQPDQEDRFRRVAVGAHEICQRALISAGAPCRFPAAKVAYEHALREYAATVGR